MGTGLTLAREYPPLTKIKLLGRSVRVSVLSDAGERCEQPVQIDGDNVFTLPVSIGLAAGVVRLLRPA